MRRAAMSNSGQSGMPPNRENFINTTNPKQREGKNNILKLPCWFASVVWEALASPETFKLPTSQQEKNKTHQNDFMAYMCILLSQISKTIFILGTLAFKEITGIIGSMHCEFYIHTANYR